MDNQAIQGMRNKYDHKNPAIQQNNDGSILGCGNLFDSMYHMQDCRKNYYSNVTACERDKMRNHQ